MKLFLRLLALFLIVILVLIFINFKLVLYGLSQLHGQLSIVQNAKPITEIIADPSIDDSLKTRLLLVEEIKKFAVDSLGLKASKNYTTYYDQHGKPLLMVLTASERYQLRAYQWKFPLLGTVSYKGFFNFKKGAEEKKALNEEGYDTDYGATGAWSTLGWFKDPVFSGMLRRNEGQLAELIIHEMTHGTIYLKSSVDFNENLASVIGEEGAIRFLQYKYGVASKQLQDYLDSKEDYDRFSHLMLSGAAKLDSLYKTFNVNSENITTEKYKEVTKLEMIKQIVASLDTISFHNPQKYKAVFSERLPNNAYIMSFQRYDSQKYEMRGELNEKFNGNVGRYLKFLKNK